MMGGNLVLVEGAVAQLISLGPSTPKRANLIALLFLAPI